MVSWRDNSERSSGAWPDRRIEMIQQTSAFLSWALAEDRGLPQIPRQRVDQGGFGPLLREPGGRALAARWWLQVLTASWPSDW
jgi:hypothetical protein